MKIKFIGFFFFSACTFVTGFSQHLVSTSSLHSVDGHSFSIGEPVIGASLNNLATQGFLQPIESLITSVTPETLSQILVYPNPTFGKLSYLAENETVTSIKIFDLSGKLKLETTEDHLDISDYSPGAYKIHLYQHNQILSIKTIIKL